MIMLHFPLLYDIFKIGGVIRRVGLDKYVKNKLSAYKKQSTVMTYFYIWHIIPR